MAESNLLQDARRFHPAWRWWWRLLLVVNILGPLLFIGRLEAQVVLGAYIASSIAIVLIHRRLGWVRLLGLGHAPWVVVVPWLLTRLVRTDPGGAFAVFLVTVILVDTACLALDVGDVTRWLAGERDVIVPDQPSDGGRTVAQPGEAG